MLQLLEKMVLKMIEHARQEAPREACGILAGREGRAERFYPMDNTDRSPTTYFMDPAEQLKVMKEIRDLNLEMVGICHSHPATPAYPSARDVELAFFPEASYVIVSLGEQTGPVVRSFRIDDGIVSEEELVIK